MSTTVVQGQHGRITYQLTLPVFSGPQADLVNARVRRSADEGVTSSTRDVSADVTGMIDATGVVTVNDGRTVQVRLPFLYNAQGAAHPTDTVWTVALRRADAQPLLLTEVSTDPQRALAVALRHASEVAAAQGQDDPSPFLTTKVSDWANWQSGRPARTPAPIPADTACSRTVPPRPAALDKAADGQPAKRLQQQPLRSPAADHCWWWSGAGRGRRGLARSMSRCASTVWPQRRVTSRRAAPAGGAGRNSCSALCSEPAPPA